MGTTKKIALNTVFQLLGKGFSLGTTLLTTALVAHHFGESGYGNFTLMTTFAAYFYLMVDFGINAVAVRLLGDSEKETTYYFRNLFTLRTVMALIFILFALLILPLIPFRTEKLSLVRWGIIVSLLTILTQSLFLSCNAIFQKNLRYDRSVIASSLGSLFTLFFVILFIKKGMSLMWIVSAWVLGGVLMAFLSFFLVRHYVENLLPSFDFSLWKKLLRPSFPLGVGLVLMVIMAKADMFILSVVNLSQHLGFSNEEALGLYGLSYKIFENALVFPTFLINALYPVMVNHKRQGWEKLSRLVKKAGTFLFLVGILFSCLGFILSPLIIKILAGSSFSRSILSLRLLLLGLPIFYPSALFVWLLVILEKENYIPPIYFLGVLFSIATNLLFIPRHGFLAAAVITGLTEVLVTALTAYFSLRFLYELKFDGVRRGKVG